MPFKLFYEYFPELARAETRCATLAQETRGVPPGCYAMVEHFCDEPGCDCRRAFIAVVKDDAWPPLAVVSFGWEQIEFYENWGEFVTPEMAQMMKGPELNPMSPRSPLSRLLLPMVEGLILSDEQYVERLKRHYRMFRDEVERRAKRGRTESVSANRQGLFSNDRRERSRILRDKQRALDERKSQFKRKRTG